VATNGRIRKLVEQHNILPGIQLISFDVAKDSTSHLYMLNAQPAAVPSHIKQDAIHHWCMVQRAEEEKIGVKNDLLALNHWLTERHQLLCGALIGASRGVTSLVKLAMLDIEQKHQLVCAVLQDRFLCRVASIKMVTDELNMSIASVQAAGYTEGKDEVTEDILSDNDLPSDTDD
jgi:hypothetical protein